MKIYDFNEFLFVFQGVVDICFVKGLDEDLPTFSAGLFQ